MAVIRKLQCQYYVFGKEVAPTSGTVHLQGYVYFKNGRTVVSVRKALAGAHIEVAKGSAEQNRVYCCKGGDFEESGEIPANDRPSQLADARAVRAAKNKQMLELDLSELVASGILAVSQVPLIKRARLILEGETDAYCHDDVRGVWYFGAPRTGKSRFAYHENPMAFRKSQNKWWDGYSGEEVVILDDLDTDALGHYLKIWTDRYPARGETKNGHTQLRHKKFIVTSNYIPEELFKDAVMAQAIRCRCKVVEFGRHAFNPDFEPVPVLADSVVSNSLPVEKPWGSDHPQYSEFIE